MTLNCDGKNLAPGMTQSHFCSQLATNYGPDCFQNKRTECFSPRRQVTSHVRSDSSHSRKESGGNKCCLEFHRVFQHSLCLQGSARSEGTRMALASLNTSLHTILLSSLDLMTTMQCKQTIWWSFIIIITSITSIQNWQCSVSILFHKHPNINQFLVQHQLSPQSRSSFVPIPRWTIRVSYLGSRVASEQPIWV